MKIVFLGATKFSLKILDALGQLNLLPSLVFGIPQSFNISYSKKKVVNSNYSDLSYFANKHKIPFHLVNSEKGKRITDFKKQIAEIKPDVILVMGWYYMVPFEIRELARLGAWGIHASMLPKYAGGAPLVWAMINGEKETGVTLFRLEDGVDDGDIIAQCPIKISSQDTIKTLYRKVEKESIKILKESLENPNEVVFQKQNKELIQVYPQRSPKDGEINLELSSEDLFNFIRAQSSPYPGAFIRTVDNKKLIIEKVRIEEI